MDDDLIHETTIDIRELLDGDEYMIVQNEGEEEWGRIILTRENAIWLAWQLLEFTEGDD